MTAADGLQQVNTVATHAAASAWSATHDFLILLILAGILFLFAYYVKRGPFVALLLSLYGGYAVYTAFPYKSLLPTAPLMTALLAHAGLYAALSIAFFIILRRIAVSDFIYIGLFGLIALSLLGAAFLIAVAAHSFSIGQIYQFTPAINAFLTPDKYFFWWFIAPAVGLFFLAR